MSLKKQVRTLVSLIPARIARRILYFHRFGKFPNVTEPSTFQEKLNVRILYDRRELLVMASSKVLSKEYAASRKISNLEIPRTLWHGTDLNEIDGCVFSTPWVLKPSHRSGGVTLGQGCEFRLRDLKSSQIDLLREREYKRSKLWAYKEAPRELILEERLGNSGESPEDFKFFVFDGNVELVQVDSGRFGAHTRVLYGPEWVPRSETFVVPRGTPVPCPAKFQDMKRVAEALGAEFDFVRVDLYLVDKTIYFGELTVYPGGGLSPWPRHLDSEMGDRWVLPVGLPRRSMVSRLRRA